MASNPSPPAPATTRVVRIATIAGATIAVLALGLTLRASLAPATGRPGAAPDIVLVVVDCLRADRLGAYGHPRPTSPRIDRLAARGMVFTRAWSTASWTKPAIASLLTGRYPHRHRALGAGDRLDASHPLLAERLREVGYRTAFLNGGNAFIDEPFGFTRGFEEVGFERMNRGERLNGRLARWLEQVPRAEPVFAYLHYMDLHLPYHRNEFNTSFAGSLDGVSPELLPRRLFVGPIRQATADGALDETERQLVSDLYDGQIRYVDRLIEALIATLAENGRGDAVLLVAGDHGEEFWEHGSYEHGHTLYEEVVRIPIVLSGPGIPRATVDAPVSLLDLHATILRIAGAAPDPESDAVDLLAHLTPGTAPAPRPLALMGTLYGAEKAAIVDGARKVIRNTDDAGGKWPLVGPGSSRSWELYDLGEDPREQRDLAVEEPEALAAWGETFEAMLAPGDAPRPAQQELDPAIRAQLEALGYVE